MSQLPPLYELEDNLKVTGQLSLEELSALADAGVKTLIFNRPNDEEIDQPATPDLEKAAQSLGMQWIHQPVISGQVTDAQGEEFGRLYAAAPKPVVAFCRTGARCSCLWALSKKDQEAPEVLVRQIKKAGFYMPDFFKRLTG